MQSRVAFNAGEFSPDMALRSDIDYYSRSCQILENWQVSQMGGVSRRRGMRFFATASGTRCRLFPYIYSYADEEDMRFIVELGEEHVRVLNFSGEEVTRFDSFDEGLSFGLDLDNINYKQINALLIITCQSNPPLVLKYDGDDTWTLEEFKFKNIPWRYKNEPRDYAIQVSKNDYSINVTFPADVDEVEKAENTETKDSLRISYWVDGAEAREGSSSILWDSVMGFKVPVAWSMVQSAQYGQKFAVLGEEVIKYWTCTQDWNVSDNYSQGMDSPANYPNNFVAVENTAGLDGITSHFSIKDFGSIVKGNTIGIKTGYWEYYTCIKPFNNYVTGKDKFTDYPDYFIAGITVGVPLPCKGEWAFYCSGNWVGCYVVRRNYETPHLNSNWEDRGISFSRYDALSNTQISGTEIDDACYMRLFITKSKRMSATDIAAGFPPDGCGNRLIVKGFKHDMTLTATPVGDGLPPIWDCYDKVQTTWGASRSITDWSWASFSGRYGYPLHCEVFNSRLVFASTEEQAQTIWLSKVDDINNFMTGKHDDDAIALTMFTTTQNPICWIKPRGDKIMLGTSEAEHIIGSGNVAFTASSATVRDHGYVGSQRIAAIGMSDKMLYVERGAGRIWSFEYSLDIDGWRSSDITVFAPHIAKEHGGFKRSSMIRKPDTVALYVLGDGQLALCTYNSLQEVKAWHRWTTNGVIHEVLGMPDGNKNDRIFLIVERDGVPVIEVVDDDSPYNDNGTDYVSVLTTNALNNVLESYVQKRLQPVVKAYIGEEFILDGDNLQVSTDGKEWYSSEMIDGPISRGWKKFCTLRNWDYEQHVSFRVKGNQSFNILALQA